MYPIFFLTIISMKMFFLVCDPTQHVASICGAASVEGNAIVPK
jgi:hypothetical protein